jgi:hypothetical protein
MTASSGGCIGQAATVLAGFGFPNRWRQAAASALMDAGYDPDAAETRDARFEFGLDCLLDGIAARIAGHPPSTSPG